eukprot:450109-Prymnesium_polylepis.2
MAPSRPLTSKKANAWAFTTATLSESCRHSLSAARKPYAMTALYTGGRPKYVTIDGRREAPSRTARSPARSRSRGTTTVIETVLAIALSVMALHVCPERRGVRARTATSSSASSSPFSSSSARRSRGACTSRVEATSELSSARPASWPSL